MTEEQWSFAAVNTAPRDARKAIRGFVAPGLPELQLAEILLCVSEAVTNAVQHAYHGPGEPGPVHLGARLAGGELRITVRDEGEGMMPRTDSPGLGLGLPTLSSLAAVDIRVDDGGTEVSMRFALPG